MHNRVHGSVRLLVWCPQTLTDRSGQRRWPKTQVWKWGHLSNLVTSGFDLFLSRKRGSRCGLQTSCISISSGLVTNANSQAHPRPAESDTLGLELNSLCLNCPPSDSDAPRSLRSPWLQDSILPWDRTRPNSESTQISKWIGNHSRDAHLTEPEG